MELIKLVFRHRGREVSGQVALPETIPEAVDSLGEEMVLDCFREGYVERQKRQLRVRRQKKTLRIQIEKLTEDQRADLQRMGLL